ncbi:acetyl-CoA synthetase-like protein [Ramaria rubella]|nr:acetyl-CoA synthetase-like protein [Ramaria rubella]
MTFQTQCLFRSVLNIRNAGTATLKTPSSTENRLLAEYCDGSRPALTILLPCQSTCYQKVTSIELQRLIPVVNTKKQLNSAQNISELIEMQVRKTPQRITLQFDQETFLTYATMDGLANDLASRLVDSGVQRGRLIALYMDKSIEMSLSFLAMHKAGGGYVPLDIDHPTERIQTIIRLAQTTMVLTMTEHRSRRASTILNATMEAVSIDIRDLSLGVILTHGSIIESAIASQDIIEPLNGCVLHVWDWSATLIAGGTLCIPRKQKLIDDLRGVSCNMDVLINLYGPTEVSTNVVALQGVTTTTNCTRIGYNFSLNSVYNLDERMRPVPLGCVGELFIGGPQVARGYLQNPEETAEAAFVADPFRPGSTMYATGDLVRLNPVDGSLSFVDWRAGRPSEIMFMKVDVGHETLVVFLEYGSDASTEDMTIVDDEAVGEIMASLRHAIRQKLPSYMAPAIYVTLNWFPVASTGKLDRKALKPRQRRCRCGTADRDAARRRPRCALMTIFTLWGDSLSAIHLASAAREAGLHLLATDIIRNLTIRAMSKIAESAVVDHERDAPEDLTVLTVDKPHLDFLRTKLLPDHGLSTRQVDCDVLDVYPTTGLQTSLLMGQDAYNVHQAWNLPLWTHSGRLQDAFEEFIDHPNGMMFRTVFAFRPTSNRPGAWRMEWTTIVVSDETELELRVAKYESGRAVRPFEQGEVATRACIFELKGFARVLVWCMHHALFDGWAMDNVISDLHDVYDRHPLPLRRSFKPMIKYLERLNRTAGMDFWRSHLENVLPTPFLHSSPGAPRVAADATVMRAIHTGHNSFG